MNDISFDAQTLLQTAILDHDRETLASMIGVSAKEIAKWVSGKEEIPAAMVQPLRLVVGCDTPDPRHDSADFRFADLFAGVGGIRSAFDAQNGRCVFTSEWNHYARLTYRANFRDNHPIAGDITKIDPSSIPDFDVLVGGFPCQPFSIAGVSKKNSMGRPHGFADKTQGTLFFDVARIIDAKRPVAFLLENVKNLVSHDKGNTFRVIRETLSEELGYHIHHRVLDAQGFVPQHRERIIIVGFRDKTDFDFDQLARPTVPPRLSSILHPEDGSETPDGRSTTGPSGEVDPRYVLTPKLWEYLQLHARKHRDKGNGFGFGLVTPDMVSRTLSARYHKDGSEILVSRGEGAIPRRLTVRECARLQGFPDSFSIPVSDSQAYKQFGNSVAVPLISAVAALMKPHISSALGR